MKKLLLFTIAAVVSFCSYAQTINVAQQPLTRGIYAPNANAAAKSTWISDSFLYLKVSNGDTMSFYHTFNAASIYTADLGNPPFDSGYIFGHNVYGLNAFGNYFKTGFGGDTTIDIIGVQSFFTGTVQPASTKTIQLKIWKADTGKVDLRPTYHVRGMPLLPGVDSQTVSIHALGIGGTAPDSGAITWFTAAHIMHSVNYNFILGYELPTYQFTALAGDTIGLCSSGGTEGHGNNMTTIVAGDTTLQAQTLIRTTTGWTDVALGFTGAPKINLSIIPIVQFKSTAGVHGINQGNMTYYGTFPNPTNGNTNVKFSLQNQNNVTLQVMDIAGHVVKTITQNNVTAGEHIVSLETANLAAGNYVVSFRTSEGAGAASQFTIVK